MYTIILCLFLAALPVTTKGQCTLSTKEFLCKGTNQPSLLEEFYKHSCQAKNISTKFSINIGNSSFNQIDYFPNLPVIAQDLSIIRLTIKNSSVERISSEAFEELIDLEYLDLSWNKLNNLLFVKYLPSFVKHLYLNNNNVTYLDDVFSKLTGLLHLDLSYNVITIIDFQNVFWVQYLNFSHNGVESLIPSTNFQRTTDLDLSHNNIKSFSEVDQKNTFYFLDLSYNQLETVELALGEKKFLSLAGNKINRLIVDKVVKVDCMDLSSTNLSLDFVNIKIIPKQYLLLRNNNIGVLNKTTLNMFSEIIRFWPYRPRVDMSNCSITDISPYYFSRIETVLLNLSRNDIKQLRNKIFLNSAIRILDMSNSNIEIIQNLAFENLTSETINLKGNKLETMKNIFNEVEVIELDLSFNRFKAVTNHSFIDCRGLFFLNLEHCLIEKIEPEAFAGLEKLQDLSLGYNKLFILEGMSFNDLPIRTLDLKGNKIDTIRKKAFNNLLNLKELNLSKVALRNLEPSAFNNLSQVGIIDLRNNNITTVPRYLFTNMDKLRTVLLDGNNITTLNPLPNRLKLHKFTLSFQGIFQSNQISNLNIKYLHIINSKINTSLRNNSFSGLYNLLELHFDNSYVFIENGALNNLFNLKYLDSQSLFKHINVIEMGMFKDLKSLEYLDLSKLALKSLKTRQFVGMTSLKTLLLYNNKFIGLENDTFYGLRSLKQLDLSRCNIGKCGENAFTGLKCLEILHLENNNLTKIESQFLFGSLKNLLELHLEHNNISILHIKCFSELSNLLLLNLQNNSLKEFPIGVFQYLPNLKVLNLSKNNILFLKTGAFSNLQNLEALDLSDNQLVNLEYVDIFFSLKQLQIVRLDGNRLKQFDFKRLLINVRSIRYIGISYNKWKCDTLSYIIESLSIRGIDYIPEKPVYNDDNIDGIGCIDMCKFVYCSHEHVEQTLHND